MGTGVGQFYATMWPAIAMAMALAALVALARPSALPAAAPVLLAWFVSPLVAYWVSQPRPEGEAPLTADERRALRRIARRTWSFFDQVIGGDDYWLPPDNVQVGAELVVAHRTSPTNIGLGLLSTLAAHDLGFIDTPDLIQRTDAALARRVVAQFTVMDFWIESVR